jgi:hypothetical protein
VTFTLTDAGVDRPAGVVEHAEVRDALDLDEAGLAQEGREDFEVEPHLVVIVRVDVAAEDHPDDEEPVVEAQPLGKEQLREHREVRHAHV